LVLSITEIEKPMEEERRKQGKRYTEALGGKMQERQVKAEEPLKEQGK